MYEITELVCDILPEGQFTIGLKPWCYGDRRELLSQTLGRRLELLTVLSRPPVVHVTILVEVGPFIIEAVGHLMADDDTDSTVVHSVISFHVEEGRL